MKKRLLSMAMALVMTLSLLPGAMFAAPAGDGSVPVDSTTFPDENFLSFVRTLPGAEDGVFTQAELDQITEMECIGEGVVRMKGIEVFSKLENLAVYEGKLRELDLSRNSELTFLEIRDTESVPLNLSHNPKLEHLDIYGTQILSLNLSHNPELKYLDITGTGVTTLDLRHNHKLEELRFGDFFGNPIEVDLSQAPQLKRLIYDGNNKLDLSHSEKLEELSFKDADSVDLSQIPQLKKLFYSGDKTLDLSHSPGLTHLDVYGDGLASLDLSRNPALTYLNVTGTAITSLDLSQSPELTGLDLVMVKLNELDLSHSPKLERLFLNSMPGITELDLSHTPKLECLDLYESMLESLDLSRTPELKELSVAYTDLTSLDLSHTPKLESLSVSEVGISSLDLSHSPKLKELWCDGNDLISLDLSHNPELETLSVGAQDILSLDLSHNPNLSFLYVYDTNISTLDISCNPKLESIFNEDGLPLILARDGIALSALKEIPTGAQFNGCSVTADGMLVFDEGVNEASIQYLDVWGEEAVQILRRRPEKGTFPDVKPGDWFYNGVTYSAKKDLMSGLPDGTFGPKVTMTRAQLVQMLYALEGRPEVAITGKFSDVPAHEWYAKAVSWAVESGITGGVGNGAFAPNNKITRQEMAVMLYAYMDRPAVKGELDFVDNADIASWASTAVVWVVENGLMGSTATDPGVQMFSPKNTATRAEAATIMMNLDKLVSGMEA